MARHFDGISARPAPQPVITPKNEGAQPKAARRVQYKRPFKLRVAATWLCLCFILGGLASNPQAVFALIGQSGGGSPSAGSGHPMRQPFAVGNGLLGWWRFDGSMKDSSPNGNDGSLTGSPSYGSGKFSKALALNGSSQYASVPANATTLPTNSTDITYEAWVSFAALPSSGNYMPIMQNATAYSGGFYMDFYNTGAQYQLRFQDAGGGTAVYVLTPSLNTWYHVVGTRVGGAFGTVQVYVNGVAGTSASGTAAASNTTTDLFFGYDGSKYLNGSIDDARIYSRALSTTEIASLYAGSNPVNCDQSCKGWWKLDEASGTVKDYSGNGNDGSTTSHAPTYGISGAFGNGMAFSGSSQYISVPDASSLNISSTISVEAWASWTVSGGSGAMTIVSKENSGAGEGYWLGLKYLDNGKPAFNFQIAAGGYITVNSLADYNDGQWHHLVGTYDGSTATLYVDGNVVRQQSVSGVINTNTKNLMIGAYDSGGGSPLGLYQGSADDIRVYNRALTPYEVYDHYLAGR